MPTALVPIQRHGRRRPSWLRSRAAASASALPYEPALIWVSAAPVNEAIDLACIRVSEAERRAADGQVPIGVMVSGDLLRREMVRMQPAAWLRRTGRIVVCDAAGDLPSGAARLGAAQLRLLPLPFSPGSFGMALAWLAGRRSRGKSTGHSS